MKSSPPSAAPSVVPSSAPTEASLIGRSVAILTPVFAVAAGWFAGVIAQAVPDAATAAVPVASQAPLVSPATS
jgi:hypothetical protein